MLQAIEANLASSTWRVSGELGSVVYHLNNFGKSLRSRQIVPHITKILQNFWLTLVLFVGSSKYNSNIYNTSLNKSQAWHIDGSTNKKNPYDFYKVLTFKWHVSKFEPDQIISLQITVI